MPSDLHRQITTFCDNALQDAHERIQEFALVADAPSTNNSVKGYVKTKRRELEALLSQLPAEEIAALQIELGAVRGTVRSRDEIEQEWRRELVAANITTEAIDDVAAMLTDHTRRCLKVDAALSMMEATSTTDIRGSASVLDLHASEGNDTESVR